MVGVASGEGHGERGVAVQAIAQAATATLVAMEEAGSPVGATVEEATRSSSKVMGKPLPLHIVFTYVQYL